MDIIGSDRLRVNLTQGQTLGWMDIGLDGHWLFGQMDIWLKGHLVRTFYKKNINMKIELKISCWS